MNYKKTTVLFIAAIALTATAGNYITNGDGTTYTLQKLSEIEGSNVKKGSDGEYLLNDTITIARGDTISIQKALDVLCGDAFVLDIQGDADFAAPDLSSTAKFTSYATAPDSTQSTPYEIRINNDSAIVNFENMIFSGIGIRVMNAKKVNIGNCSFLDHNGSNAGAVMITFSGNDINIHDCLFDGNAKAGVASAATSYNNIRIENCTFTGNSTNNQNIPQINITAGPNIIIKDNDVIGDSTLTNVGGIGVSNLMMAKDTFNITVEGNNIRNNRYGLTFTGPMNGTITNNTIVNNKFASNAMTGGAGISLYYTGTDNKVVLRGNDIENNLWGITLLGNSYYGGNNADLGTPNDFGNNTFRGNANGGTTYALYNNQSDSVWAVGNYWLDVESNDSADIAKVIVDHSDDSAYGVVVFMPANQQTNGISHATVANRNDDGSCRIYDINGRLMNATLSSLPKGLYIIKQNDKTRKVVI